MCTIDMAVGPLDKATVRLFPDQLIMKQKLDMAKFHDKVDLHQLLRDGLHYQYPLWLLVLVQSPVLTGLLRSGRHRSTSRRRRLLHSSRFLFY